MTDVVDAVADVVEEVAEQAIDFAEAARQLSRAKAQFGLLGLAVGLAGGGAAGYFIATRRLETKFNQIAEDEIAQMREHYQAKILASEDKGELADIVRDNGYIPDTGTSEGPPMAVSPTSAVVDAAAEAVEASKGDTGSGGRLKAPVPAVEAAEIEHHNVFEEHRVANDSWDYEREKRKRTPDEPYVIHVDERKEFDYEEVIYTYYVGDDVLCREDDSVLDEMERENLIGEANLEKFGHGSNDASIVYIRNDNLEMEIEVVRSPNSYLQEVAGITPDDETPRRGRRRDRSSPDDD